jgi:glycosyltransferase involved in cell wall biosynthesis
MKKKVLIFIVCYHAEKSIESVLDRIPQEIWENQNVETEILVIDDQSHDRTFHAAEDYARRHPQKNLTVLYNPKNQGYGGNQKIGYHYAIEKGFDVVVLLHGDGQYAPEYLPQMIQPILDGEAEVVFGSRMMHRLDALKGHMPFYKWIGNQILTFTENRILKSHLSEFHTGYRAYSVAALASVPFEHDSNYFDFDTDIIIQMLDTGKRIKEIPIPTFYGNEISRVNGIKYAIKIIRACLMSRAIRLGIYYHPKFDYETELSKRYQPKFGYPSSHQLALDEAVAGTTVLKLGYDPGFMAEQLAHKNVKIISIDKHIEPAAKEYSWKTIEADIDEYDFNGDFGKVDTILALDVIEHLKSPERLLDVLRKRFSRDAPDVIMTTGNVSFFPIRLDLLFGRFGYGNRGILDMDHKRLFTFSSLKRTLEINGYEVLNMRGIPAPFPLALGNTRLARFLLAVNRALVFLSKGLFSYQIFVIAKPRPTLEHLLEDAHEAKKRLTLSSSQTG